jgi:C1A family cysteine protease/putative hemolysin
MPPEGWCCLNGEVFPASEAGCYDEGGSFFGTQEEAEDYCRGEMPPEGWCCLNGEVFPSSDVQCSDEGGSFFATREEAEDYCRGEIKDEIIGSSDGTAGQTFTLTKIPVISEEIWVNEFDALSEEEMDNIVADGNLEVEEVQDENRNTTEFWIKWRAVDDLLASSNDDRHYEIDRERGIITFGDGTNGAIPPVGVDNIKANYRYGVATLTPTFMPTPQPDIDLDGVTDAIDNCLNKYNPNQEDYDNDGVGDVCDCSDGIKGGDEENVDCGGSFCVPCDLCNAPMSQFPYSFDWRNWKGTDWMSPVKDQDGCGSCWAFAAVGAVEAKYNIERNTTWQTADLSEQNLVSSCCTGGSCSGGNKNAALLYIKNSGIVDETCFPYQSQQCWLWDAQQKTHYCANQCSSGGTCSNPVNCNTCAGGDLWKIKDFHVIKFTKEEMTSPFTGEKWITTNMVNEVKRALVCHGPLAICSGKWGHCIVLVGWDDATGNWIIKNSWGTGWGNNGYGTIPYANHDYSDFIWYGPSYPEDVYRPGVHVAPAAHIPNAGPSFALVNPAAAYCSALGYEYVVETGEQGERGLCQFPDGQTVDAWEFLQGKVAPEYSYCEIRGCEIKTVTDPEKCLIFGIDECAVCSLEDGTEVEVTELMGLSFEESTCGDQTCGFPENFSTCPEDCASGEWDAYCDGVEDGKCDPDCLPEDDPDCKIFPWALVSSIIGGLLAILTVAAIIVYLRVFRRKKASAQ